MIATDVLSLNPTMIRFHPTTITKGSLLLLTCSSRRRFLIFFLCSLCLLLIRSRSTFLSIKSASRIKSRDSATEIPPTWRLWLSLRGTGSSVSLDDSGLPVWSRGAPSIVTGCKLSIDSNAVLSMGGLDPYYFLSLKGNFWNLSFMGTKCWKINILITRLRTRNAFRVVWEHFHVSGKKAHFVSIRFLYEEHVISICTVNIPCQSKNPRCLYQ